MLKPIDHQNIVIRLIGMSECTPTHITQLAHSWGLPVCCTDMAITCEHLRDESVLVRHPNGAYSLTGLGEVCLANTPPMERYYVPPFRENSMPVNPLRTPYVPSKCPDCQRRRRAAEFRDPGTGEPLPACKRCMRIRQRGSKAS